MFETSNIYAESACGAARLSEHAPQLADHSSTGPGDRCRRLIGEDMSPAAMGYDVPWDTTSRHLYDEPTLVWSLWTSLNSTH